MSDRDVATTNTEKFAMGMTVRKRLLAMSAAIGFLGISVVGMRASADVQYECDSSHAGNDCANGDARYDPVACKTWVDLPRTVTVTPVAGITVRDKYEVTSTPAGSSTYGQYYCHNAGISQKVWSGNFQHGITKVCGFNYSLAYLAACGDSPCCKGAE